MVVDQKLPDPLDERQLLVLDFRKADSAYCIKRFYHQMTNLSRFMINPKKLHNWHGSD